MGNPTLNAVDTIYLWYNAFTKAPVASQALSYVNGSLSSYSTRYISQSDLVLNIETKGTLSHLSSAYPNPTSGKVNIQELNSMTTVTVFNLMGEIVISETTDGPLNLSHLPEGSYYIQYSNNGITRFEKLIKN